jgi:hypothetical protein
MQNYRITISYGDQRQFMTPVLGVSIPDMVLLSMFVDAHASNRGDPYAIDDWIARIRGVIETGQPYHILTDRYYKVTIAADTTTLQEIRTKTQETVTFSTTEFLDFLESFRGYLREFEACVRSGQPFHGLPVKDEFYMSTTMYFDPHSGQSGILSEVET